MQELLPFSITCFLTATSIWFEETLQVVAGGELPAQFDSVTHPAVPLLPSQHIEHTLGHYKLLQQLCQGSRINFQLIKSFVYVEWRPISWKLAVSPKRFISATTLQCVHILITTQTYLANSSLAVVIIVNDTVICFSVLGGADCTSSSVDLNLWFLESPQTSSPSAEEWNVTLDQHNSVKCRSNISGDVNRRKAQYWVEGGLQQNKFK